MRDLLFWFLICLVSLCAIGGIAYFVISYFRYRAYLKHADQEFDEIVGLLGEEIPIEWVNELFELDPESGIEE